jgi:hypothetical protein
VYPRGFSRSDVGGLVANHPTPRKIDAMLLRGFQYKTGIGLSAQAAIFGAMGTIVPAIYGDPSFPQFNFQRIVELADIVVSEIPSGNTRLVRDNDFSERFYQHLQCFQRSRDEVNIRRINPEILFDYNDPISVEENRRIFHF